MPSSWVSHLPFADSREYDMSLAQPACVMDPLPYVVHRHTAGECTSPCGSGDTLLLSRLNAVHNSVNPTCCEVKASSRLPDDIPRRPLWHRSAAYLSILANVHSRAFGNFAHTEAVFRLWSISIGVPAFVANPRCGCQRRVMDVLLFYLHRLSMRSLESQYAISSNQPDTRSAAC